MATKLYSTIVLACALSTQAQALTLTGPVDFNMLARAAAHEDVEITSPGGNMLAAMTIAQILKARSAAVRVVGLCASGCAMIAIGSGRCTVARSGHLVLHAPVLPAGVEVADLGRTLSAARAEWATWMRGVGVPSDLIDATLRAYRQQFELLPDAMKRVGCAVE